MTGLFKRYLPSQRLRPALALGLVLLAIGVVLVPALHFALMSPSKADEDEDEDAVKVPSRVTVKNGVVTVTLNATARQSAGIITVHPQLPPSARAVVAYGTVLDAGPLTNLSNQYLDAASQLRSAKAKLAVSRAAFERANTLYNEQQNVSKAQLQAAEGNFHVDEAALAAARARLTNVCASAAQAWGPVLGKALIDQASLIDDLIQRRNYLVRVTLPASVAPEVTLAKASAVAGSGPEISLDPISLATSTDPAMQGISYFYEAPATKDDLPGRNLLVSLPASVPAKRVVVPQAAVVWFSGKAWIYLRTGPDTFVRRQIDLESAGPDAGYVVTGLSPGTEIVVQGAQMLASEEFRAQAAGGDED